MKRMFKTFKLGNLELVNRFVFPPVKIGRGNPDGTVTDRQLTFYQQIARNGPGVVITEPVSVTAEGREHPKQPCIHLPESVEELRKIVDVIHEEGRLACLHLNHGGAAANPKIIGGPPKAPSVMTCVARQGNVSEALTKQEIEIILDGYKSAVKKAKQAGFDVIEIQGGHGYLISQFLNKKINKREDRYGRDRSLFAREALSAVKKGVPEIPCILRISGNEMSPEFGISHEDLLPLLKLAEESGINAIHVGMGNACFSPPWYFHHTSLPDKPQIDALAWVREHTALPVIVAGRMGRKEKLIKFLDQGLGDLVALGRPLIADPDLIEKWQNGRDEEIRYCGYCLQGCLHRMKSGEPLGCNLNPEIGLPELVPTSNPMKVLIAGGGPAGMSAALYMSRRGHKITLAEKTGHLGGQFALAWQAPGKEKMKEGFDSVKHSVRSSGTSIFMNRSVDAALIKEIQPDLLVWAVGAVQNIPKIKGLDNQNVMTCIDYFREEKKVKGPRILVIGVGQVGLEITEKLGKEGYDVVAIEIIDQLGGSMEMITKKLTLMRIEQLEKVALMSQTAVKEFKADCVGVEKDGKILSLEPFQSVILASGMLSASEPDDEIKKVIANIEIIGDASNVQDIFTAVRAGYELACKY
ncbi:MAG: FAD-dependent oxidoreductase [Deltaproteobacteria bacterium]|nr:FAD-dependent oxidoreductase [Deltaproteobacteria bacterium]